MNALDISVTEHSQTKLDYYDLKLQYKNLKNELHILEKKKKIYEKNDINDDERQQLNNEIDLKEQTLKHTKTLYKEKKSQKRKEMIHRTQ